MDSLSPRISHETTQLCHQLHPQVTEIGIRLARVYDLSTCNSDSSSSIFHMPFIAIIPIHMEIPTFYMGSRIA